MEKKEMPAKGLAGLKKYVRYDLLAGFSVSLIALPLCLGIALASGVPPMAGIFTAVIGGMVASRLAGSYVTISGPAAGLIVITLGAVESLGGGDLVKGYPYALAAIVLGGGFVVLFGLLRVGKFADFFPSAAVHGLLAAIGIIIMVKQSFVALGVPAPKAELIETIAELPAALTVLNPEILAIALIALAILIVHPKLRIKWIRLVPAPLWVLIFTIPLSHAFDLFHEHHYHFAGSDYILGPKFLVNLPDRIADGIVFPDFGMIGTGIFWVAVVSVALVSGLESLLSAKAVDALDPWKRKSNLNMDLVAMGTGSALSGLIGGLPMISEIVRSSANINNGARTQWANFFHGTFLLIFLLVLTPLIEQIPLAALAAMLIFTGFRLASPKEFKGMLRIGPKQFAVFVVTVLMVIATDLLIGIAVGVVTEFALHIATGASLRRAFRPKMETHVEGDSIRLRLGGAAIFTNYLSIKQKVTRLAEETKHLVLDFSDLRLVDHTVQHNLHDLEKELAKRGVTLEIQHKAHLHGATPHPLSDLVAWKPKHLIQKRLSVRQLSWMVFAMEEHFLYSPQQWQNLEEWEGYGLFSGKKVTQLQNRLEIHIPGATLYVGDLTLSSGALITANEERCTAMRIVFAHNHLPTFRMERETLVDRLLDNVNQEDIDFEQHERFSAQFFLRGANVPAIREFFHPDLIRLFESHPGVEVESTGNSILVRACKGLMNLEETRAFIAFGKNLGELAGMAPA